MILVDLIGVMTNAHLQTMVAGLICITACPMGAWPTSFWQNFSMCAHFAKPA
jgi:hypothetical protein